MNPTPVEISADSTDWRISIVIMAPKRSAPQAAAAAEPAAEEEVAFPRGGGHSLSALEAKQLRAEGAAQARAEAAAGGRRNKKARTEGEVDLVRSCMLGGCNFAQLFLSPRYSSAFAHGP